MSGLPAITIWQPWAELIMAGLKPYEFRAWPAPHNVRRRRIAIHAGAHQPTRDEITGLVYELRMDRGHHTLGLRLTQAETDEALRIAALSLSLPRGVILGTVWMGDPQRATDLFPADDASPNMWGWPVTEPRRLPVPLPARGQQGWWTWSNAA
jgi:hypothetical protein